MVSRWEVLQCGSGDGFPEWLAVDPLRCLGKTQCAEGTSNGRTPKEFFTEGRNQRTILEAKLSWTVLLSGSELEP